MPTLCLGRDDAGCVPETDDGEEAMGDDVPAMYSPRLHAPSTSFVNLAHATHASTASGRIAVGAGTNAASTTMPTTMMMMHASAVPSLSSGVTLATAMGATTHTVLHPTSLSDKKRELAAVAIASAAFASSKHINSISSSSVDTGVDNSVTDEPLSATALGGMGISDPDIPTITSACKHRVPFASAAAAGTSVATLTAPHLVIERCPSQPSCHDDQDNVHDSNSNNSSNTINNPNWCSNNDSSDAFLLSGSSERRTSTALTTLIEHMNLRQRSPSPVGLGELYEGSEGRRLRRRRSSSVHKHDCEGEVCEPHADSASADSSTTPLADSNNINSDKSCNNRNTNDDADGVGKDKDGVCLSISCHDNHAPARADELTPNNDTLEAFDSLPTVVDGGMQLPKPTALLAEMSMLRVRKAYVLGRPFRQYVRSTALNASSTTLHSLHSPTSNTCCGAGSRRSSVSGSRRRSSASSSTALMEERTADGGSWHGGIRGSDGGVNNSLNCKKDHDSGILRTVSSPHRRQPCFRQNAAQYISALAVSEGDLVAVGDRAGRVAVMQRRGMTEAQYATCARFMRHALSNATPNTPRSPYRDEVEHTEEGSDAGANLAVSSGDEADAADRTDDDPSGQRGLTRRQRRGAQRCAPVCTHKDPTTLCALRHASDYGVCSKMQSVTIPEASTLHACPKPRQCDSHHSPEFARRRKRQSSSLSSSSYHVSSSASASSGPCLPPTLLRLHARTRDPFDFFTGQHIYRARIDPLYNVEVVPAVCALAFLPRTSDAAYLLASNEKMPKLFQVSRTRESVAPFHAVDKLDTKAVGPLTASSRHSVNTMRCVAQYALHHENNIHSIGVCPAGDQFVTGDELSLRLWCVEYTESSVETYDLRPPANEEAYDAIRAVRSFPHEPFLLFVSTSAGAVYVIDTRQTLRWKGQVPQIFVNPPRDSDGDFSLITNSLSSCALSPCGRYVAGRDLMTVCLWDVRVAAAGGYARTAQHGASHLRTHGHVTSNNNPNHGDCNSSNAGLWGRSAVCAPIVNAWALHPHLQQHLELLYQFDLFFEPFDIQFMTPTRVGTGGFGNTLHTVDVHNPDDTARVDLTNTNPNDSNISNTSDDLYDNDGVSTKPLSCTTGGGRSREMQQFFLPRTDGVSDVARRTIRAHRRSAEDDEEVLALPSSVDDVTAQLSARVTLMSRPRTSMGGVCDFLVSCGQVLMQLQYEL